MNKSIVISQPMFFPWVGMFEQIRLADVYVHYDDVQFSKGHFTNRVQIKTPTGFKWLTIPLQGLKLGQRISEIAIDNSKGWKNTHIEFLKQVFRDAPFKEDVFNIVNEVYSLDTNSLSEMVIAGLESVCNYYNLFEGKIFSKSSDLNIEGKSTQRVLDLVKHFDSSVYITGHGALRYLDHELFEANGVQVEYMDYKKNPYKQAYGEFNPYVSILDLIANTGKEGIQYINSTTINWKKIKTT